MSRAYLLDLLEDIRDKMYDTSQLYREAESDKRAHFITLVELDITAAVRKSVAAAMGISYRKVPRNIKDKIRTGTKDMFDKYRDAIQALDKDNQTSADIFSSKYKETGSKGRRKITVVFSNKPGKETSIFEAFKRIKRQAQEQLVSDLNDDLNEAGIKDKERISKRTGKSTTVRPIDKNDFLDVGHMGNSAVQIQRVSKARDMLIDGFQDAPNEAVRNYIKQLEGSLKFNLKRLKPLKKKGGKEVTEIGLEFKGDNRKVTDVPQNLKKINQDLEAAIASVSESLALDDSSPSYIDDIESIIINGFVEMPGKKVGIKKKKIDRKRSPVSLEKPRKASVGKGASGATKSSPVTIKRGEGRKQSPINLMTLINSKLPRTVRSNMGFPALENQTGRFASSARVVDVSQTAKGFPSVGYTYQRQPYGVFEASSGSRFADPDRDPRTLIDKSIREIASEMVSGRLFTRRV